MHDTQVPFPQTLLVPHDVPLARSCPVSAQVIVGEQEVRPAWHGLSGVQASPAVHETQAPLLHTRLVPQEVPLVTLPLSVQTGAPVVQAVLPVRQGFPVTVQAAPVWQETQLPAALQTLPVPHVVPAARTVPVSLQTGVPVEQASDP